MLSTFADCPARPLGLASFGHKGHLQDALMLQSIMLTWYGQDHLILKHSHVTNLMACQSR